MKKAKALFIDCDGVLYDKRECTDRDIAELGLNETLAQYHISPEEFTQARLALKKQEVRGLFNTILSLCKKYNIDFDEFATNMASNENCSKISADLDMLTLLKKVKLPV